MNTKHEKAMKILYAAVAISFAVSAVLHATARNWGAALAYAIAILWEFIAVREHWWCNVFIGNCDESIRRLDKMTAGLDALETAIMQVCDRETVERIIAAKKKIYRTTGRKERSRMETETQMSGTRPATTEYARALLVRRAQQMRESVKDMTAREANPIMLHRLAEVDGECAWIEKAYGGGEGDGL